MQKRQDKKTRLQAIRLIVSSQALESQEDLQVELDKAGFPCTQTTLSRDLKQLRISKVRGRNGHSVYALPREGMFSPAYTREEIHKSCWQINFSGNLMVVHTPPGHASMVAYDIDNAHHPFFLGTVAGDDTVLVVLQEDLERERARTAMSEIVPQLFEK
ncbi:MAG: arginine repressor [Bacteroidaceae bacterium]|nr:arginine repressor [Bacteroidaceae bacterium]